MAESDREDVALRVKDAEENGRELKRSGRDVPRLNLGSNHSRWICPL